MKLLVFCILISHLVLCNTNSLNKKSIEFSEEFSFIVAGHSYGQPSFSVYPAQGLVNNVDRINQISPNFVLLLGDNIRVLDSLNVSIYKTEILEKLQMPVFNAIGNHDLRSRVSLRDFEMYHDLVCENTVYSFVINSSLFIILDSEISNGQIDGEQLEFLEDLLPVNSLKDHNIKNVFISCHRTIERIRGTNYRKDVVPLLSRLGNNGIDVYLLSGDLDKAPTDLYMYRDSISKISYVHTHLSGTKDDKILQFKISKRGSVSIIPISLLGLNTI